MRELVYKMISSKLKYASHQSILLRKLLERNCVCVHACMCRVQGVGRQWLEIFYGKTSRNLPGLQQEIKIPIFPSKWSLVNPHQLWLLCFPLQTQLSLKDLGLLMLLRLASTAFKNVSFSLDETGKRGSQVWMRVSLLGTELGWAVSQPVTRKKLKGKNCFCWSFPYLLRALKPEKKWTLEYDCYPFFSF